MGGTKSRINWLDTARCFAIFSVVLCHSTEGIYEFNIGSMMGISLQSRIFGFTIRSIGRLGVPIFLFITGYLLLNKTYDTESWLAFWKKNFLRLLIVVEIWTVIYNIFLALFNGTAISISDLICNMLFLKEVELSHVWYMPMILGIYLFLPLIANCVHMIDKKILYVLLSVLFVGGFIVPIVSAGYQVSTGETLSFGLNLSFFGGYFGVYLILGYFVRQGAFDKVKTWVLYLLGAFMLIIVIGMQLFFYYNDNEYYLWYNCAFLFICTLCIFLIFSRIPRVPLQVCVNDIARKSFGIYLLHNPVKMVITSVTHITEISLMMPIKVIFIFVTTFLISWAVVTLISKIPKVGCLLVGIWD